MILKIEFTDIEIKNRLKLLEDLASRLALQGREPDAAVFPHGTAKGESSAAAVSQQLLP